jgi:hypothetical protein
MRTHTHTHMSSGIQSQNPIFFFDQSDKRSTLLISVLFSHSHTHTAQAHTEKRKFFFLDPFLLLPAAFFISHMLPSFHPFNLIFSYLFLFLLLVRAKAIELKVGIKNLATKKKIRKDKKSNFEFNFTTS